MDPLPTGRYGSNPPDGFGQTKSQGPLLIKDIRVIGKFMWWELETAQKTKAFFHVTYGMSGQWSRTQTKHASFFVEFSDPARTEHQRIFFNDQRRFGTLKFVLDEKQHEKKLKSLGPDVLQDSSLSPEIFAKRILMKPNRTIAEALMDQTCISGIGNYLRAEILFECGVNPWKSVVEVSASEYVKLCEASQNISRKSYESQGASIKTYRNVRGEKGSAQFYFKVYAQERCPNKHTISRRKDANGRMVHWCNSCQP